MLSRGARAGGRAGHRSLCPSLVAHLRKLRRPDPRPSHFVRAKLMKNGWPAGRIRVLPHFQNVSGEGTAPAPDAPILFFGRLSEEKGVFDLLRAMLPLPAIRLQIAGEGPLRARLEAFVHQHGMANVSFTGH